MTQEYEVEQEPPSPTLSAILRELHQDAPPVAPLDLISTVSSLVSRRFDILRRREEEAEAEEIRIEDEKELKFPVRATIAQLRDCEEKAFLEKKRKEEAWDKNVCDHFRARLRPWVDPLLKMSRAELEHLVDEEVEKEATGPGLEQAENETARQYKKRITALEKRIDKWAYVDYKRRLEGPLRYTEGLPASLIAVHPNIRPLRAPTATERMPCLQCKVRGMPCSRTMDFAYGPRSERGGQKKSCSRCKRNGDRCLVKLWDWKEDEDVTGWKIIEGNRDGELELAKEWFEKKHGKKLAAEALPAWHENDQADNSRDQEYKYKGWWNVLKDRDTQW
ncbi:hypothetical protein FZEAL_6118 [Fusarium zealandicum]|uniref:Uncharacterized protein n=1 Tax=Fusarium zealandicum TaxID=1053134 RepID=A0A8H4XK68_9HYPO|nr:hypothetical protein FZEAL_6118 [Fusarium zealandicum]